MEIKSRKNEIFIIQSKETDIESSACFGYELNNVIKDVDNNADVMIKRVIEWHKSLLNAFNNQPIKFAVECKIKNYPNISDKDERKIRIAMLFYVVSENPANLVTEAAHLSESFAGYFSPVKSSNSFPYLFIPILTQEHLNEIISLPEPYQVCDYVRKPVYFKNSACSLGYKSSVDDDSALTFIPQFFIPDMFSLGNTAHNMLNARLPLDLSVYLAPMHLSVDDLTGFKKLANRQHLVGDHFTQYEKETYFRHLEILFDDNTNHFLFHVRLIAPDSSLLGHSIHNSIADTFFGNMLNVKVTTGDADMLTHFLTERDKQDIMPYLYPGEIVQQSFRLPVSSGDDLHWFSHKTNIHGYFPSDMPETGILMGEKKFPHHHREVRISTDDLARHLYIMGQTGVGKTTLLKSMILDHINAGHGICVVDPHGDLVSEINDKIPFERLKDLVYFDPTLKSDIKFNVLEYNQKFPEQRTFIFNELIKIIDDLYDLKQTGGPMFELYLKNAMLLVMERKGTLADVYKFFFDKEYRDLLLEYSKLKDSVRFFKSALNASGEMSFEGFASYITSKINRFVQDDFIAPLISSEKGTINFRSIIDSNKIFLVRLPKGRLGSEGVKFIGTLLFNRIIMAAMTRENIHANERVPFYMYIDEFQNFTSGDIEAALSEARKYGLRLIMANQTLSQLKSNIEEILLSNVGSQVFFRPGPNIIDKLKPYYRDYISEQDFVYLSNFNAFARLMSNNTPLKPFIFQTIYNPD
jgi:hypothetical protein